MGERVKKGEAGRVRMNASVLKKERDSVFTKTLCVPRAASSQRLGHFQDADPLGPGSEVRNRM